MIKREGVSLMNKRTGNVGIAHDTIDVLKAKQYTNLNGEVVDISESLDAAIKDTILYRFDYEIPQQYSVSANTVIEVTQETTTQAAIRLLNTTNDVVALNFASARNVGGGFLSGAVAQEEDLARSSGLYFCLKNKPVFYNDNILCENGYYTDNILYSPKVPFFRGDNNLFLIEPYLLSIISAPAPNAFYIENIDEDDLYMVFFNRAMKVLQIAAAHNHKTIILGGWGCGSFGNPPELVSKVFADVLMEFPGFDHICFAIYDNKQDQPVYNAFKQTFNK